MSANDQGIHCIEAVALVRKNALYMDQSCREKHSGTSVAQVCQLYMMHSVCGSAGYLHPRTGSR